MTTKNTDKTGAEEAKKAKKADAEKKAASSSPVAVLPSGTGTQNTKPPASNPKPIERSGEPESKDEPTEDVLRLQKDKARWTYGTNADDLPAMLAEQREISENQK